MKGNAGFYNGMERDLSNHNQGLEQSVLELILTNLLFKVLKGSLELHHKHTERKGIGYAFLNGPMRAEG